MKTVSIVVECEEYAIISHIDADSLPNDPKVKESVPLRCGRAECIDLETRDKRWAVNPSLLKSFVTACEGADERWKLVSFTINKQGGFVFGFSDLEAPEFASSEEESKQRIVFPKFDETIYVYANHPGNDVEDKYLIEACADSDFDEHGERVIAYITEQQNGQCFAFERFIQRKDGKFYLRSSICNVWHHPS